MLGSLVLVAIITVGLSYAYLSAVTNAKDNVFIPAEVEWKEPPEPHVDGLVDEGQEGLENPKGSFESQKAQHFVPNYTIQKLPYLKNNSYVEIKDESGEKIQVEAYAFMGAKVDYKIWVYDNQDDETGKYVQVSLDELLKFVTIDNGNTKTVEITEGTTDSSCYNITQTNIRTALEGKSSDEEKNANTLRGGTKSSYYVYNKALRGAGRTVSRTSGSSTYTITNTVRVGDTTSEPLFKSVTVKRGLNLNTESGRRMTMADIQSDDPLTDNVYSGFKFDIVVTGYGLLLDTRWTNDEIYEDEPEYIKQSGALDVITNKFVEMAIAAQSGD